MWRWFAGSTKAWPLPLAVALGRAVRDRAVPDGERPARDHDGDRGAVRVPAEVSAGGDLDRLDDQRTRLELIVERSEEHTSELQSRRDLVCRLLLEKKNIKPTPAPT